MTLSADQRAVLELILERGQSYDGLAGLLGLGEGEVRERARGALAALGGADPDRNAGLTDYLLGQADPITRAEVARHLRIDAEDRELAARLLKELREIAPAASLPSLPADGTRPPLAAPADGAAGRQLSLPSGPRARLIAGLGAGAVILLVVVLAVTGVFSGDDGPARGATPAGEPEPAVDDETTIPLLPARGGDASGIARVGITEDDQPFLDLELENLEPASQDQVYVVWFLFNRNRGYPLSPIATAQDGSFNDRFAIPSDALPLVARSRFINVSIAPIREVRKVVRDALNEEVLVVRRAGRTVVEGEVPVAGGEEE